MQRLQGLTCPALIPGALLFAAGAGAALVFLTGCGEDDVVAPVAPVGSSPTFTEFPGLSLMGVYNSSLAWGDCDNDGDLDLAVAGFAESIGVPTTKLYENDGAGGFTEFPGLSLTGLNLGSLAWGDCDNDGDLDLAIAGYFYDGSPNFVTTVYENNGAGGFTEFPGLNLTGVAVCSLAWGDCDNDGDLDLVVAGATGTYLNENPVAKVYRNDGGTFTDIGAGLTGVCYCSLAWGDCDNDGDLDLAVAGYFNDGSHNYVTTVYENDGAGGFTEFPGLSLTGVADCSLAWGDCDNDGDLDLAVAGWNAVDNEITRIYANDGAGGFTELPGLSLTGVYWCSLAWGDCDNDGDLDLALAGRADISLWDISKVYRNDGVGGFAEFPGLNLAGMCACSLAWGDCDNDGDLDLAVAGNGTGVWPTTTVWRNDGPLPNVPPAAPTGLEHLGRVFGHEVLRCNAAGDAETPAKGLSYNLMIRDASGLTLRYPAMAHETTGARLVAAAGPVLSREPYVLFAVELAPGDYEARVQAVDSGFEGGPWSQPCFLTVP